MDIEALRTTIAMTVTALSIAVSLGAMSITIALNGIAKAIRGESEGAKDRESCKLAPDDVG